MNQGALVSSGEGRFALNGVLSFDTAAQLLSDGQSMFSSESSIQVDLTGVSHCDSAGVALLVEWLRLVRAQQKDIQYHNVPAQLSAIAEVSGLAQVLPLSTS